jgi:hypothetical protein
MTVPVAPFAFVSAAAGVLTVSDGNAATWTVRASQLGDALTVTATAADGSAISATGWVSATVGMTALQRRQYALGLLQAAIPPAPATVALS